ncbi:MAG: endonuclease III [Thermoproteota archaeon]|nr:endonuclease III [Thermoproteota archaeon]
MMRRTLQENKLTRLTALKNLQQEEQGDPFKILIGTILSARTRDENTTRVLKELFDRFKDIEGLSKADLKDIRESIHSIGFYNIKAERIKQVVHLLIEKFGGKVPSNLEDLLMLPGVGRKTANCVLVYAFNQPAIPVDVHVHRISNRLGIVNTRKPEETELHLCNVIDKEAWIEVNETFVSYGQNICLPIKPRCNLCHLKKMCKFYKSNIKSKAPSSSSLKE